MIDIHPPEHTPHTWRDFFIHIATIVLGLVIAIGLEQTVEWVHHRNERRQLEHDLVVEANNNLELMKLDYAFFNQEGSALAAVRGTLANLPSHPAGAPRLLDMSALTGDYHAFFPDSPVWNTAKESGIVALLPRREAAMYDLVYGQQALMTAEFHSYDQERETLTDFCLRFTGDSVRRLDLATLSPDDRRQFSVLLANLQGEMARFRRRTDFAQVVTLQAARGETNDQQAFEKIGVSQRH